MATFVIGDIHGELEQLKMLLEKMDFNAEDKLFVLGDVIDRGVQPIETLQYLMKLPNCTCILGNHEFMMLSCENLLMDEITDEMLVGFTADIGKLTNWMCNGGGSTISDLSKLSKTDREEIFDFVSDFKPYIELDIKGEKYLLVHAGISNFSKEKNLEEYTLHDFTWERPDYNVAYFDDITVVTGHTPTFLIEGHDRPGYIYRKNNHIAIDCGAFVPKGRLAGICLETGEEFYSR